MFNSADSTVCACVLDVGIYVDNNGKRSRPLELMWPAPPTAASELSTCTRH